MHINLSVIYFQKILVCPKQLLCRVRPNFHYLLFWISLHTTFANYQVKWSGVRTQHMTTPFVDEMYDLLKNTLTEYEVIICRWPEYIFVLENVCQKLWILLQILQLLYLYQLFFLKQDPSIFVGHGQRKYCSVSSIFVGHLPLFSSAFHRPARPTKI
jgi:hypothetical protein